MVTEALWMDNARKLLTSCSTCFSVILILLVDNNWPILISGMQVRQADNLQVQEKHLPFSLVVDLVTKESRALRLLTGIL